MKSNTHKIKTIAVLWFRLYLHVKLEKQHNICVHWISAAPLSAARWADAEREREREREREEERERGVCALNRADAEREREREVYAHANRADAESERERERGTRWQADAERERGVRAEQSRRRERERERERERCCTRWESKTSRWRGSIGDSQKTRFGRFFEGKNVAKGSAMFLSWQHSASPFLQQGVGPRVKQKTRCVNRALKN